MGRFFDALRLVTVLALWSMVPATWTYFCCGLAISEFP